MRNNPRKTIETSKALAQVAAESALAITQINQQAAQELAGLFQKKVAELLKTQDPKTAFDHVHAEVLQDAAKEVSQYRTKLMSVLSSGNQELSQIAQSMIEESKLDLIHFVNEATNNAPPGSEAYVSVFKTSFNTALQNFELVRAAMADSFNSFEKSVEGLSNLDAQSNRPEASTKKRLQCFDCAMAIRNDAFNVLAV